MGDDTITYGPEHAAGHRARLRARFLKGGVDGLADYELLELILAMAIPRRDVKPLAKDMIAHFGSYGAVLAADSGTLIQFKGLGEGAVAAIKAVEASAHHLMQAQAKEGRIALNSAQALADYLRGRIGHNTKESFHLLLLDRSNRLLEDVALSKGGVDNTVVDVRRIVKLALDHNASAVILAHNHPSGDPTPSATDVETTKQVGDACENIGISLHDHVIVTRDGYNSFKANGLL